MEMYRHIYLTGKDKEMWEKAIKSTRCKDLIITHTPMTEVENWEIIIKKSTSGLKQLKKSGKKN